LCGGNIDGFTFCAPSFLRPVVSAPRRFCAPSFVLLMASLLLGCLAFCVPSAQAQAPGGGWTVSYTPNGSLTFPTLAAVPWGQTAPNEYCGWNPNGPNDFNLVSPPQELPITSSGTFTVTFTWTGTGPPPATLNFLVSAQASTIHYSQDPTPTIDDGYQDAAVKDVSQGIHLESVSTNGASVVPFTSKKFLIKNSSQVISHLEVSLTAFPISINLSGQNSANQALTGQQIMATLATPNGLPSGTKITSYTWSFSGGTSGNPIKTWNENGVAADGKTPQQLFQLTDADKTATDTTGNGLSGVNPLSFYDEIDKDAVTVKCAVNLTFPDGTTGTVNAVSPQVTFLKPTGSWSVASPVPYVDTTGGFGVNEVWNPDSISVPSPFSGGSGCFAQLITPSNQATRTLPPGVSIMYAPPTYYLKVPDGKGSWQLPTGGLDAAFPYPYGYPVNSDGSLGTAVTSNYTWDVSGKGASGDRPKAPYSPSVVTGDIGGTNWYSATMQNTFTTYMMYKPSSPNAIWVPLMTLSWNANVTVSNTSGSWAVVPNTTSSPAPSPTKTDTPPSWTSVNNASAATMRP